jgi:hypothetical protein
MVSCITTFSKDGYELYGHRMIDTWLKFWPENYKLQVYTEGYSLSENHPRLKSIDIENTFEDLLNFKKNSQALLGIVESKRDLRKIQKTIKWSHKVYVMKHALKKLKDDFIIFLDGDTYTTNSIPVNFAEKLVKKKLFAVHFEQLKKHGLHFETGLIVFNTNHHQIDLLRNNLTAAYDNLDIYKMKKTWDGFWFAHLYKEYKLDVLDLSLEGKGVFGNKHVKDILKHDVGSKKYLDAGYNEFTGRKL